MANNHQKCQACGGKTTIEKVNLEEFEGGKLYLMEKVPAYVCQDCGEIWVPEEIMQEFEKMIDLSENKKTNKRKKGAN